MEEEDQEITILTFITNNVAQILLFLAVFIIIIVVEHINHFNAKMFAMPSAIPGTINVISHPPVKQIKKRKR